MGTKKIDCIDVLDCSGDGGNGEYGENGGENGYGGGYGGCYTPTGNDNMIKNSWSQKLFSINEYVPEMMAYINNEIFGGYKSAADYIYSHSTFYGVSNVNSYFYDFVPKHFVTKDFSHFGSWNAVISAGAVPFQPGLFVVGYKSSSNQLIYVTSYVPCFNLESSTHYQPESFLYLVGIK